MRGILRHSVSGISDVDPHGTIGGHPACIATTGATRDEGQEEQCCEPPGGSVGAWQSPTERQAVNSVEEGTERLRPSTECYSERGNSVMYYERCEMCGNRWQRIHLTMVARDPETKLNNRTVLTSTGKRPVEIERPFCPHGHGSMMMQATPQQSLHWECSTCSTTSGLSLDGCDVRLVDRGSFEGADANLIPIGGRRDTVPLNVQGQLKDVDQEVYLQLIYEIGQRPENQITTLGHASRQKVESGEQVTELFNAPEGFFFFQKKCIMVDSNRQSRSLAGCVWPLKEISMKCA